MLLRSSELPIIDGAVRFFIVGIANTAIGIFAIYLAKWLMAFDDWAANVFGYAVGLAVSFVLNKNWTFGYGGPWLPAVVRFLAVFLVAYLANLATVLVAIEEFSVNSYAAHALGVLPYALLFYIGSRYVAFRRPSFQLNEAKSFGSGVRNGQEPSS